MSFWNCCGRPKTQLMTKLWALLNVTLTEILSTNWNCAGREPAMGWTVAPPKLNALWVCAAFAVCPGPGALPCRRVKLVQDRLRTNPLSDDAMADFLPGQNRPQTFACGAMAVIPRS